MPRPRKVSDHEIFEHALTLMQENGSAGLTFATLSTRTGLSGSTLVQRFGTKEGLIHAALVHSWEGLEARTRQIASEEPKTPGGAVAILSRLSIQYGDIETYADQLHLLGEDLRHPDLRARGEAWVKTLAALIRKCFADTPGTPGDIGLLMIARWQGALILWSFSPGTRLQVFVRNHLNRFLKASRIVSAPSLL